MAATWIPSMLDVRIGSLAQSLCERTARHLPAEITNIIAGYFEKRHLLNLCLLSRRLLLQANAIIYHDITLDFGAREAASCSGPIPAVLLARTLVTSKTAAYNVRRLSFVGSPLSQWRRENRQFDDDERHYRELTPPDIIFDLSSWSPDEVRLYNSKMNKVLLLTERLSDQGHCTLSVLCLTVMAFLTELRYLYISSDCFRYSSFRDGLKKLIISGGLQSLETSSLCLDLPHGSECHVAAVLGWDEALFAPLLAPAATSITVVTTLQPEAMNQLRISSLTHLIVRHYQTGAHDLDTLLAALPQLRYLEYHAWVDYGWDRSPAMEENKTTTGLEPLFDALHHVNDTLECLITSHRVVEDSPHFQWGPTHVLERPFRLRTELSNLRHLSRISVPYASLLGWKRKTAREWDWDRIFPASLRDVTWTDHLTEFFYHDDWEDHDLLPVISSFLDWMAKQRTSDEDINFGLFLPRSIDAFNEPERKAILELCKSRNITCSIEKRHRDRAKDTRPRRGRGRGRGL